MYLEKSLDWEKTPPVGQLLMQKSFIDGKLAETNLFYFRTFPSGNKLAEFQTIITIEDQSIYSFSKVTNLYAPTLWPNELLPRYRMITNEVLSREEFAPATDQDLETMFSQLKNYVTPILSKAPLKRNQSYRHYNSIEDYFYQNFTNLEGLNTQEQQRIHSTLAKIGIQIQSF